MKPFRVGGVVHEHDTGIDLAIDPCPGHLFGKLPDVRHGIGRIETYASQPKPVSARRLVSRNIFAFTCFCARSDDAGSRSIPPMTSMAALRYLRGVFHSNFAGKPFDADDHLAFGLRPHDQS